MTDQLERTLERAGEQVRNAITIGDTPHGSTIRHRATRRRWTLAVVAVTAVLVGGGIATRAGITSPAARSGDLDALITREDILADGVVTEDEYRAAAQAVVTCHASGGFVTQVAFDDPDGHASFSSATRLRSLDRAEKNRHFEDCLRRFLPPAVSLGWASTLGQVDLDVWRHDVTTLHACVLDATGLPIGALAFDEHGFLTRVGQDRMDTVMEYGDHEPASTCIDRLHLTFGLSEVGRFEGVEPPGGG